MSSPTLLIAVAADLAVARTQNFEDMTSFLGKAKHLYTTMMELSEQIERDGGRPLQMNIVAYAQAEARAKAHNSSSRDGYDAMQYAHAYWQSLKHPWYDQLLKQFSHIEAEKDAAKVRATAQLDRMAADLLSQVKLVVAANSFTGGAKSAGPQFHWDAEIDKNVKVILEHTPTQERKGVSDSILQIASKPREERLIALDVLRLSIEQKDRARFEQDSLRIYKEKQAELARKTIIVQLARCEGLAGDVESAQTDLLAADLQRLRTKIPSDNIEALEDRLEAIERSLIKEKSTQTLLQATVQLLKRQGYKQVEVMSTLRPQDIGSIYLMDPNDDQRMTLVRASEDETQVAAMVVSREQVQASKLSQQLDFSAQTRLCKAMDVAERALSQQWECEVVRTAPGEKVKLDRRLKDVKIAETSRSRVQQQQQQRSLPS